MRFLKQIALMALLAFPALAQNYQMMFSKVTTVTTSAIVRGSSVNAFHQLTVTVFDNATPGSCAASVAGGWAGNVQMEASMDNLNWFILGNPVRASTGAPLPLGSVYVTWAGAFEYIRVRYTSAPVGTACPISAWYSGNSFGFPSTASSIGSSIVFSGQQAVTATAAPILYATAPAAAHQICVKANVSNGINVYLGGFDVTITSGLELAPDEAVCIPITDISTVYVVAASPGSAVVSWQASN